MSQTQENTKPETLRDFEIRAMSAPVDENGMKWIETTDEVIKHYVPCGVKEHGYFIWRGVHVFMHGGKEKFKKREETHLDYRGMFWNK